MGSSVTGLRAVALLEFLAGAAPARIVAADLVPLGRDALLRGDSPAAAEPGAHSNAVPGKPRGGNRVRPGERLMLIREPTAVDVLRADELLGFLRLDLRVVEEHQDLLADEPAELLEHHVPLRAVLDERILLRERP